jgi:hypothetical protein
MFIPNSQRQLKSDFFLVEHVHETMMQVMSTFALTISWEDLNVVLTNLERSKALSSNNIIPINNIYLSPFLPREGTMGAVG